MKKAKLSHYPDFGKALVHITEEFGQGQGPAETSIGLFTYAIATLCSDAKGRFVCDDSDIAAFCNANRRVLTALCAHAMRPHLETGCGFSHAATAR